MWIHRAAILARIVDCAPEIFDDSVFTLASLGAMVQVRLTKQAFENLPAAWKALRCHVAYCFLMPPSPHLYRRFKQT